MSSKIKPTTHSKMKTNITKKQFFTILNAAELIEATANLDIASGDFLDFQDLVHTASELRTVAYDLLPDDEEEPTHEAFGFTPEVGL